MQFIDTTAVESLYGERHESEPQGLGSAWDAPTKRPVWHLHSHSIKAPPSACPPLLAEQVEHPVDRTCFVSKRCLPVSWPVSKRSFSSCQRQRNWSGGISLVCFVKLRLIDETRAFVACMITHDPWRWCLVEFASCRRVIPTL